jgi:hypothetical protein
MNNCDLQEAKHVAWIELTHRLKDGKLWKLHPRDRGICISGPFQVEFNYSSDRVHAYISTSKGREYIPLSREETSPLFQWHKLKLLDVEKARAERQCKAIMKALRPWWKFW